MEILWKSVIIMIIVIMGIVYGVYCKEKEYN